MQIHLVTLGVSDLSAAERFYTAWLRKKPSQASNDQVKFYDLPGAKLSLFGRDSLAEDAGVSAEGEGFRSFSIAFNVARKEEVAELLEAAVAAGGKLVKPAQDVFWGGHSGYVADPDGNLIEVAWNPHFAFQEDGSLALP